MQLRLNIQFKLYSNYLDVGPCNTLAIVENNDNRLVNHLAYNSSGKFMYVYIYIYICIFVYVCVFLYVCTFACMYICMHRFSVKLIHPIT